MSQQMMCMMNMKNNNTNSVNTESYEDRLRKLVIENKKVMKKL